MKKITFIFFALVSGTVFAQSSATSEATATVNAEIVMPILINNATNMDFGRIIGNAAGGTVTLDHANNRTADNDDLLAPGGTYAAATFDITAGATYNYNISIPSVELSGSGDAMTLDFTNSIGDSSIGTGAAQPLVVGGTLTVNGSQDAGDYTGTVKVTVSYE